jgi:predicted MFS family arabinose efflux permease
MLSRGLGVSLTAVTSLIAVNQATALLGVFFGPVADRFGYRLIMLGGLGMLVLGMLGAGILPVYYVVMAALFLAGLGKSVFDPAIQAYVSSHVTYQHRGRAIGLLETSWAGSTLIGIPCMALLINWMGWRAPFYFLGLIGLAGMVAIGFLIPKNNHSNLKEKEINAFRAAWPHLLGNRSALGALGYSFCVSIANDNLFVIYGIWLERSFGISVVLLGIGTGVIGLAELCGEGLTAVFSDRWGLKKSVAFGVLITVGNYMLIPWYGKSLPFALTGIFLVFLSFEFMIVSSLSLCTEILPQYRATMMSAYLAAGGLGRVLGAMMGVQVWLAGGIMATGVVSAVLTMLAFLSLTLGLKGWRDNN